MNDTISKRVNSIAKIPEQAKSAMPPIPKSVKIELSGRCNYRCKFCALSVRNGQPKQDMDWDLFKRITLEMRDIGVTEIGVFFIGESFMNPSLLESAIAYLKQELHMPYVFLTSNGSLARPQYVEQCMKAGLDSLKWSVNAANEQQFHDLLAVPGHLMAVARKNIKMAWLIRNEGNYKTRLYASSIRYDDRQHAAMQAMLSEHVIPFVDEHYWLPLYSMGSLTTRQTGVFGYKPVAGNTGTYDNPVEPLPCWSCFTEGHVLSDGRLSACCFDATGEWVMGDLRTQSFKDAWYSPKFQSLRNAHIKKDVTGTTCENCAMIRPWNA